MRNNALIVALLCLALGLGGLCGLNAQAQQNNQPWGVYQVELYAGAKYLVWYTDEIKDIDKDTSNLTFKDNLTKNTVRIHGTFVVTKLK